MLPDAHAEDQPLDREAAEKALAELAEQVNAGQSDQPEKSVDEVSTLPLIMDNPCYSADIGSSSCSLIVLMGCLCEIDKSVQSKLGGASSMPCRLPWALCVLQMRPCAGRSER